LTLGFKAKQATNGSNQIAANGGSQSTGTLVIEVAQSLADFQGNLNFVSDVALAAGLDTDKVTIVSSDAYGNNTLVTVSLTASSQGFLAGALVGVTPSNLQTDDVIAVFASISDVPALATSAPVTTATPVTTSVPDTTAAPGTTLPATTAAPVTTPAPTIPPFAVRIDCGSGVSTVDAAGNTWLADTDFDSGIAYTAPGKVGKTTVVNSQRFFQHPIGVEGYHVPVPAGTYNVALHFAELDANYTFTGARVFKVTVQGLPVSLNNGIVDVYAHTKKLGKELIVSQTVTVADSVVAGTLPTVDILFANFPKNPIINGIEVLSI